MSAPFISKLILKNFKCYEHLEILFSKPVTILYGQNGSGKTTVLEGLVIAASAFLVDFPDRRKVLGGEIGSKHIRLATPTGQKDPEFQWPTVVSASGSVLEAKVDWEIIGSSFRSLNSNDSNDSNDQMQAISKQGAAIAMNGRKEVLPMIAYFSTRRLFVPRANKSALENFPGRAKGYFNLASGDNIHEQIRNWIKDQEYLEYQTRMSNPDFYDKGLSSIYSTILNLFSEWERIYYFEPTDNSKLPNGLFFVPRDKSQTVIPESSLSDGYRNLIWLLLEIAWRAYILNPFLGEKAAKETNGIVMIDEVELHLHPKWQQEIVGILVSAFPKIQFVITTHSPIVLGSVKDGQVIRLEGQTAAVVERPYGLRPSTILQSYMGVSERLPELQGDILRYFELLNQGLGTCEEAVSLRSKLESVMSREDPMFSEADVLIQFLS